MILDSRFRPLRRSALAGLADELEAAGIGLHEQVGSQRPLLD